jgi:hypothetical protein
MYFTHRLHLGPMFLIIDKDCFPERHISKGDAVYFMHSSDWIFKYLNKFLT